MSILIPYVSEITAEGGAQSQPIGIGKTSRNESTVFPEALLDQCLAMGGPSTGSPQREFDADGSLADGSVIPTVVEMILELREKVLMDAGCEFGNERSVCALRGEHYRSIFSTANIATRTALAQVVIPHSDMEVMGGKRIFGGPASDDEKGATVDSVKRVKRGSNWELGQCSESCVHTVSERIGRPICMENLASNGLPHEARMSREVLSKALYETLQRSRH